MPGYDFVVYENVCKVHGHALGTTVIESVWDEANKVAVETKEVLCFRCGVSLTEVRTMKPKKVRTPRAKQEEAQGAAQGVAA